MATQAPFNGLNLDSPSHQIEQGDLTFALNAVDAAHAYAYSKEMSHVFRSQLPTGYVSIGALGVLEQNRIYFFLFNPQINLSQIGYVSTTGTVVNGGQQKPYVTVMEANCLNFSLQHPIVKPQYSLSPTGKLTLYFTDDYNPPRLLEVDSADEITDCEKLRVFLAFAIPQITGLTVEEGGELKSGVYQFAIAYADSLGNALSPYYSITNPISVYAASLADLAQVQGDAQGTTAGKSVRVTIAGLDSGQTYFNLIVIATVESVSSYQRIATFSTKQTSILFTGKTDADLTLNEILAVRPYYTKAGDAEIQNKYLMWVDLETEKVANLQKIANNIRVYWQTERWKYSTDTYAKPENTTKRGFMRDEVYPIGVAFLLVSGRYTPVYHIPGRKKTSIDTETIDANDPNFIGATTEDACSPQTNTRQRWQLYNTATKISDTPEFLQSGTDPCFEGGYQYGEMAYWESTQSYPDDTEIWGELANTPIRHHKFPDSRITHHHDSVTGTTEEELLRSSIAKTDDYIYPLGIRVEKGTILIPTELQDQIVGYKIVRGNRVGNKSVVAKGLVYNVWDYVDVSTTDAQSQATNDEAYRKSVTRLFSNYPYNDLRPNYDFVDIFADTQTDINRVTGYDNDGQPLTSYHKDIFTFDSPDTHFGQPTLGSMLKIEANLYGYTLGKYEAVAGHARYDINVGNGNPDSGSLALGGDADNLARTYKSRSNYNGYTLPPATLTLRAIQDAVYLKTNSKEQAGSIGVVNNVYRESSVILKTDSEVDDPIVADRSRWTTPGRDDLVNSSRSARPYKPFGFGSITNPEYWLALREDNLAVRQWGDDGAPGNAWENQDDVSTYTLASSWYCGLKRNIPNQYGDIFSIEYLDTGFTHVFNRDTNDTDTIFGGDIFISRFSMKRKVNFFPKENAIGRENMRNAIYEQVDNAYVWRVRRYISEEDGGGNDNYWLSGRNLTLFSYGIPYYFVESEYNCELRSSDARRESEYYPKIRQLTFSQYLEEIYIAIENDNVFLYNNNYSKQNNESPFILPPLNGEVDTDFASRVIYSEPGFFSLYKAANYYDFPEKKGQVTGIFGIENNQILVLFRSGMALYNAVVTLQSNSPEQIVAGDAGMFASRPVELYTTDNGYGGSQHKAFVSTEFGHFYLDAQSGAVFQFAQSLNEISSQKTGEWFKQNLPLRLREYFPEIEEDNIFNGIGISIGYDPRYKRVLFTKQDYVPVKSGITYTNGIFSYLGRVVDIQDLNYFCPVGWTLSYNPLKKRWISFHSYLPQAYLVQKNHFITLLNGSVYDHYQEARLLDKVAFGQFGGKQFPFVVESIDDDKLDTQVSVSLQVVMDVKDHTDSIRFPREGKGQFFDELVVYNDYQSTGILHPVVQARGDMRKFLNGLQQSTQWRQVIYSFSRQQYHLNAMHDMLNTEKDESQRVWLAEETNSTFRNQQPIDKVFVHVTNPRMFQKKPFRSKFIRGRFSSHNGMLNMVVKFITFIKTKAF